MISVVYEAFLLYYVNRHLSLLGNSQGCGGFENEAIGVPVTPPSTVSARLCVFRGDEWADLVTESVAGWVQWSLVSLVFCRGKPSGSFLSHNSCVWCLGLLGNLVMRVVKTL